MNIRCKNEYYVLLHVHLKLDLPAKKKKKKKKKKLSTKMKKKTDSNVIRIGEEKKKYLNKPTCLLRYFNHYPLKFYIMINTLTIK